MTSQIQQLSKDRLHEALAKALGWELALDESGYSIDWIDPVDGYIMSKHEWQPTSDTEKGKAQCFDLMVELGIYPQQFGYESDQLFLPGFRQIPPFNKSEVQRKVCEAALIALQESE